jgi:Domain of unknown function (DUF4252)
MRILLLFLTALLALPAWAQEDAMKDLPGYVDFGQLDELFGEPSVQIAVGPSLLNMVSALSASDDPETAALFKRLKGVRIQVFENSSLAGNAAAGNAADYINSISSRLAAAGWESVAMVNSAEEQLRVFMKINDAVVEGMTVMTVEEGEATFINVIGNLNPEELDKVMDSFDAGLSGDDDAEAATQDASETAAAAD